MSLILREVEVAGQAGLDVAVEGGRIVETGPRLARSGADEIDGRGGALIPGLIDHHIHLFALAAQATSVDLAGVKDRPALEARLAGALAALPAGAWLRATGYHEAMAGALSRRDLDVLAPQHPIRIQHQTGSLWMLNSAALAAIGADDGPDIVERDHRGRPTGRIWRGDAWLRQRIGGTPPDLAAVGRRLAACGITGLTDASVTTDQAAADRMAADHRTGALPQRLMLMSAGPLAAPEDDAIAVGPVKVLLDDHDLPPIEAFAGWIAAARDQRRAVAVHCVTAAELAVALAAFEAAGTRVGDRIEHGGVIAPAAIAQLKALGLAVVTQSAFVRERGDRYAAEVEPRDLPDLYRCASLIDAGVPVGGSSDAPYASPDPWAGIAAAAERRTRGGLTLGPDERLSPERALGLYLGAQDAPGGPPRRLEAGAPADLCLLRAPLRDALAAPAASLVAATIVGGKVVYAG